MTISESKNYFENELKGLYPPEEIQNFFYYALSHLLEISKLAILSHFDKKIDEKVLKDLDYILLELKKKNPIQYILGKADFYGMVLQVNPSVLIPRPETEELVDWVLKEFKNKAIDILDVCTGSGCIAIALKKHLVQAKVAAVDISSEAIDIAKNNSKKLGADIKFKEADALNLTQHIGTNSFDVIVSNPPYVLPDEKETMNENVLLYEPQEALFVPENDPLLFYKAIAQFAKTGSKKVALYFEINETKGIELSALLGQMGFTDIIVKKDINGKDRMLKCTYLC
jgi:release factor glutamine methyltransferase